jgi:hypothetical protein
MHQNEYDAASILDQVNALLQQDPLREVYISIPEMTVSLEIPENNGLMVHAVDNEGHVGIEIGEIAGGIIVASTVQMPESLENDGNGNLLISWNDDNVEIGASVSIDEQTEALTVNSLTEWPLTWTASISGLTINKTNVVTGEGSLETVDLRFQGATETTPGRAGIAPQPMAGDNERFLRGDGAWAVVSTAKEVALLNEEPDATNTEALDNESIIFYEEQSIQPQTSGLMDISISGNAATSDRLNHPLSVSVDGGAVEGSSLYTFDGSAEKTVNLAGGSGISLTGVSGTITINANPFRGATSQVNGATGIVPAPTAADREKYLRGDGTWSEVASEYEDYTGATASSDGISGLVPAAASAERNGTLHGDGTWSNDVVVTETMPTASDAGTVFFYIED